MSQSTVSSCDGCDTMAPAGYLWSFPRDGYMHVRGSHDETLEDEVDVCSWECLATVVAARIAEGARL